MDGLNTFQMHWIDYMAFGFFFVILSFIGLWVGRREKADSSDYFLAGRRLPWYAVGGSFIASNISAEHFIGMVGAAFIYGVCVAKSEWGNIWAFSFLIWIFIPFLMASRVFTVPEFLERRYNFAIRQIFAAVTIVCNILAFLAAVLYGGGVALNTLMGWPLWVCIAAIGIIAGVWAIYGGLRSVVWTDLFTLFVMLAGGLLVSLFGLYVLSGSDSSILKGFSVMLERNQGMGGEQWDAALGAVANNLLGSDTYNRLSIVQPLNHPFAPWMTIFVGFITMGIWYNVLNQFMIQRVLAARSSWDARMGIVMSGYLKILLPTLVVMPGLIYFAMRPDIINNNEWGVAKDLSNQVYVDMVKTLIPLGIRGLILAALFGAIQSTVNSVLNSTSTVFTLDIFKRWIRPQANEKTLVRVGMISTTLILILSMMLAWFVQYFQGSLFIYIQLLYAFFAAPFSAIFVLGVLSRRVNGFGAVTAILGGFVISALLKIYYGQVPTAQAPALLEFFRPFIMQATLVWAMSVIICWYASKMRPAPSENQVNDQLTLNFKKLNIFQDLGDRWYRNVVFWWGIFVVIIISLMMTFSGLVFSTKKNPEGPYYSEGINGLNRSDNF